MSTITREGLKKVEDLKTETVTVKEWDADVILRTMSGREREAWEYDMYKRSNGGKNWDKLKGLKIDLLALTIVDENGKPIFNDDEGKEILGGKSPAVLDRLFEKSQKLNGLTADDVEELEKN